MARRQKRRAMAIPAYPAACSGAFRPLFPVDSGHPFRVMAAAVPLWGWGGCVNFGWWGARVSMRGGVFACWGL